MRCTRLAMTSTRHLLRGASTPFVGLSGAAGKVLRIERATRAVARRLEMEKRKLDAKQEEMDKAELETKQMKEAYENAKNENETVVAKRIELEKQRNGPDSKATRGCVGEHGETPSLVEEGRSALS